MASLEGGCGAVAFASGIAAQAAALFTLLQPGDHVVSSSALYGGTVNQFKHLLRKMNVDLTWVDPDDPDAWRAALRDEHQAVLRRDDRQPGRQRARHRGGRRDRARARGAADRRQHLRDAVSLPADRVGRRHRHPLGDQVHRRPRHEHRRRRRRLGGVQLVERPLPGDRRPLARLPRAAVPRDVRHLRLLHEAARRDPARSRRRDEPVQRVPLPAGARDVVAAHGTPRRERPGGRRRSSSRRRSPRTSPIRACSRAAFARSSTSTCREAPAPSSRSTARAGARRARTSSAASRSGRTWRTSATRRASSSIRRARRTASSATRSSRRPASAPERSGSRSAPSRSTI